MLARALEAHIPTNCAAPDTADKSTQGNGPMPLPHNSPNAARLNLDLSSLNLQHNRRVCQADIESIATGIQQADPKLSDAEALSKACELPAGQMCAAIERQASLQGVPFEVEEVEAVDTPVLGDAEAEIQKRLHALMAKAENKDLSQQDALTKIFAQDPGLYARYRSAVTLSRDGLPLASP